VADRLANGAGRREETFGRSEEMTLSKTHDYELDYEGFRPEQKGRCRIRIYDRTVRGRGSVIVCTAYDASAYSITNAIEYIAADVITRHFKRIDGPLTWIEHYPFFGQCPWGWVWFERWTPQRETLGGRNRPRTGIPHWTWLEKADLEKRLDVNLDDIPD